MLSIVVLGAAAGGGVPQWNCGCPNCVAARQDGSVRPSTQASIAVSADGAHWFLVNASPDLRQQINATAALHPEAGSRRNSPIAGVILTNGEVDAVAGLLSLREGAAFDLHAHPRVLDVLAANSIFGVLDPSLVRRLPVAIDVPFEPALPGGRPSGLEVTAFAVPGKPALYLEAGERSEAGDTLGLSISSRGDGRRLVFLAACAELTPEVRDRLAGADLVFFDGTLWRDDELIVAAMGRKTGRRMGHLSMIEVLPALAGLDIGRRLFLHINNSNPALAARSDERLAIERAGWEIPADGMEITL